MYAAGKYVNLKIPFGEILVKINIHPSQIHKAIKNKACDSTKSGMMWRLSIDSVTS